MTNIQLTEEFLQGIYTVAVSGEIAEKNKEPMSAFDLLCAADAAGGIAHLVRKLIDELRADRAVLQERRKADSEPVGTLSVRAMSYNGKKIGTQFGFMHSDAAMKIAEGDYPLYLHAQPVPDRDQVRREHAEWSQATFGNVGPVGPLKHLSKEALEAAAEPGDLSEWADMQFLLWDAQRRAGITDEQITQAMIEKLAVNKQREWPEPKDGEPRLHIKEQPAPVVQCPFPCGWDNLNKLAIQDAAFVAIALVEGEPATESIRQAVIANNDRLLKAISACRAAMLNGGKP